MDQYLKPYAAYARLLLEYHEHGSLVIGVDFDGTVHDYHKTGESHEMVRKLIRDLKEINCKIIWWTCYKDHDYVIDFCMDNDLPSDGINTDGIALNWECRKPFFSAILDDRAGLKEVYEDLTRLVYDVKQNRNGKKVSN